MRTILRAARVYVQNFQPKKRAADYRDAVGGMWDVIGPLQFEFVKSQGLKPHHNLLDIGCGSLRGGRFFIVYLDAGHYMGTDLDEALVREGLAKELPPSVIREKRPEFAFNEHFLFPFAARPDFAIAQSLFTHLKIPQIKLCLSMLRAFAPECHLFATFNESAFPWPNRFAPNSQRTFFYTRRQLDHAASEAGWQMRYIGDWGHPRDQKMACFTVSPDTPLLFSAPSLA